MLAYQKGDSKAFYELYSRHSPRVYGYLKKRLIRKEERDEVFQKIFLKFHKCRAQFSPKYKLVQWLFVISKSELIDHFRKLNPSRMAKEEIDFIPSKTFEDNSFELLESLSEEQKNVINWRIMDGLSYSEISKIINRPSPTVRQIFSRAIKKLRKNYE